MIRPAVIADARLIAEVIKAAWQTAYTGIVDPAYPPGIDPIKLGEYFTRNIAEKQEIILVDTEEESGRIVGFISGRKKSEPDHDCEAIGFYLRPEYQGQGRGRRLFAALSGHFRQEGGQVMLVRTLKGARNNGFYRHLGGMEHLELPVEIGEKYYDCIGFLFILEYKL